MNRQTEDRLRAAFDAKAEQVTDERLDRLAEQRRQLLAADLDGLDSEDSPTIPGFADADPDGAHPFQPRTSVTRLDVDHPAGSSRHARWFAPVLAAAAVIAVAVGVTAVSTSVNNGKRTPAPPATGVSTPAPSLTPTPTPTPSSTPPTPRPSGNGSSRPSATATPPAQVVPLGHGKQADRSQIPWNQVGPGWTLALWTPSTKIDERTQQAVLRNAAERLFLVNPVGGRYLITTLPVEQTPVEHKLSLIDWSGDGRRALFQRNSKGNTYTISELDLGTGAWREFSGTRPDRFSYDRFSYTKPLGLALLVHRVSGTERVNRDGSRQLLYPTTQPGIGEVHGGHYTPDGSQLVRYATDGWVVTNNDGTVVRTLSEPAGFSACRFNRWWTATTALASCSTPTPTGGTRQLWLMPITGAAATPLVAAQSSPAEFKDAVQAGSRTFLEQPHNGLHCDTDLSVLQADGVARSLNFRGRTRPGNGVHILQATRQTLYVFKNEGCGVSGQVISYDPRADALTTLLGGRVNGGSVLDAVGYRATDPPQ